MSERSSKAEHIHELYRECQKLAISDTFDLLSAANDDEERDFIRVITDFMLQQRQKRSWQKRGSDEKISYICRRERLRKDHLVQNSGAFSNRTLIFLTAL